MAISGSFLSIVNSRFSRYLRPGWVCIGLLLFSLLFFAALLRVPRADRQLIGSDGFYYYAYVRSLCIDHDLNLGNEYAHFRFPEATATTPTGLFPNKYAVGPALLWMPFFLAAHAAASLGHVLGLGTVADGYSSIYQAAISIGSIVYGALGLWLAAVCAMRLCSQLATAGALALVWLASNLFYYMVFEPSMSHMVALFSVSLLLSIWFLQFRRPDPPRLWWGALLGAAGGLVLVVRLQDAPLLLLPFGALVAAWLRSWRAGQGALALRWLGLGLTAAVCTAAVFSAQLLVWRTLYGTWAANPYLSEHSPAFSWLHPQIGGVLFSSFHGLLSWHPVYLLALVGLALLLRRDLWLSLGMLAALALDAYIVAAWWCWWQGDAFGGRMFLDAAWIWLLGLAAFLEWAHCRRRFAVAIGLGLVLIAWNGLALIQYRLGFVPMNQPLTWEQMTVDRLKIPWELLHRAWR